MRQGPLAIDSGISPHQQTDDIARQFHGCNHRTGLTCVRDARVRVAQVGVVLEVLEGLTASRARSPALDHVLERALDESGQMQGDSVGRLGRMKRRSLRQILADRLKLMGEGLGDERLVQASGEVGHRQY